MIESMRIIYSTLPSSSPSFPRYELLPPSRKIFDSIAFSRSLARPSSPHLVAPLCSYVRASSRVARMLCDECGGGTGHRGPSWTRFVFRGTKASSSSAQAAGKRLLTHASSGLMRTDLIPPSRHARSTLRRHRSRPPFLACCTRSARRAKRVPWAINQAGQRAHRPPPLDHRLQPEALVRHQPRESITRRRRRMELERRRRLANQRRRRSSSTSTSQPRFVIMLASRYASNAPWRWNSNHDGSMLLCVLSAASRRFDSGIRNLSHRNRVERRRVHVRSVKSTESTVCIIFSKSDLIHAHPPLCFDVSHSRLEGVFRQRRSISAAARDAG
jgi:hypothetical protein